MKVKFYVLEAWSYEGYRVLQSIWPLQIHKRKDFIKGIQLFCQVIWLGHPPSSGSPCLCLCLSQVSMLCPISCAECQSHVAKHGTIFLQKEEITCWAFWDMFYSRLNEWWIWKEISQNHLLSSKISSFLLSPFLLLSLRKLFVVSKYTEYF